MWVLSNNKNYRNNKQAAFLFFPLLFPVCAQLLQMLVGIVTLPSVTCFAQCFSQKDVKIFCSFIRYLMTQLKKKQIPFWLR